MAKSFTQELMEEYTQIKNIAQLLNIDNSVQKALDFFEQFFRYLQFLQELTINSNNLELVTLFPHVVNSYLKAHHAELHVGILKNHLLDTNSFTKFAARFDLEKKENFLQDLYNSTLAQMSLPQKEGAAAYMSKFTCFFTPNDSLSRRVPTYSSN